MRHLIELGTRAPSLHNSQPWLFRPGDDGIEILADPARTTPVSDPTGWAARLALGAAAFNVRLGFAESGRLAVTEVFPDDGVVVRVRPVGERPATPAERALIDAIPRRHSNRRPYRDEPVPDAVLAALVDAAAAEACRLTVLGPAAVTEVADLIAAADDVLEHRPGYAAERRRWMRGGPAADGVRADRVAGRPDPGERLRRRDYGARLGAPSRRYESDPCLAVLSSSGAGRHDDVRAGRALQHVLLRATASGLTASMFSQPIEVAGARARLAALTGGGTPQMVLRVGYGPAHEPAPRRPADEVTCAPALPGTPTE
ncbi:Acg family FMN-binding oxidoreductase [Cryptosporangium japonicum]|uniref:Nitroreductase domain-containing protein n=1 Tax=Cryptosporangium japonicum TaxID=80872 RepID=A0ABN0U9J2_9ACTN